MISTPATAEARPTRRSEPSGVASTLSIARFAAPGKAANTKPSMANRSPSATRNSDIAPPPRPRGLFVGAGVAVPVVARLSARIDKIAEKFEIGAQQHARVVRAQAGLIGLHGTIERE